jgi:hypothetical protein
LEALLVFVDFPAHDVFGGRGFAAAIGEVGCGYLLQVVDVVDEAAFDLVHARIDVSGDGDVDEEHGAVAAGVEKVLAVGAIEDFLRSSGAGDDDVGARDLGVEIVEGNGFGLNGRAREVGSDFFGAGLGAVGNKDGGSALLDEVSGG